MYSYVTGSFHSTLCLWVLFLFLCAAEKKIIHFHFCIVFYCSNRSHFLHSTVDGHLGSFYLGDIINSRATNILVRVFGDI